MGRLKNSLPTKSVRKGGTLFAVLIAFQSNEKLSQVAN
jgi:hypothetical protein